MEKLIEFLDELESRKIFYKMNKIRDAIMVEISVPGERWEVEFMVDGDIQVEKFISNGNISDESELEILFVRFSD